MRVYRRPHKGKRGDGCHFYDSTPTGSKEPSKYIDDWQRTGEIIWFNGSSWSAKQRQIEIGVEVTEDDVCALFNAVVERYQQKGESVKTLAALAEPLTCLAAECKKLALTEAEKQRKKERRAARQARRVAAR